MPSPSLIDHFAALEDPRQSWKVLFPLPEVLLVVLCGTLAGAEDFVEIRRCGQVHQEFLRRLLPYKAGVPSHDTLNDVINAIDGALFAKCFTAWVEGLRDPAPALVSHDVGWLITDRRFPDEPRFAGLRAIAVVEAEVERNGSTSLERHLYLSSLPLDAKLCRRRALPLACREPPALGAGCGVPRGSQPLAIRRRAAEHGHRPAHGDEPPARTKGQTQHQGQAQVSSVGHYLYQPP